MVESDAPQQVQPEGTFDYERILVLLVQGEGGNVRPYKKHLDRIGLLQSQKPIQVEEIKALDKAQTEAKIAQLTAEIESEHITEGKKTFVHVYYHGRAALMQKNLQMKFIGEKSFYPIETTVQALGTKQHVIVWAVFDCDRNLSVDPDLPGAETSDPVENSVNAVITHAVGLGQQASVERSFADQLGAAMQSFLHAGSGSFELVSSLQSIDSAICKTQMLSGVKAVSLNGRTVEFSYKGDMVNGKRNGNGKARFPEGKVYEGDWLDDKMHGFGTITFPSGNTYTGEFFNDKKHGIGTFIFPEGSIYQGEYFEDKKQGKGTYYWPDGSAYHGDWLANKKHGHGTLRDASGGTTSGIWVDG